MSSGTLEKIESREWKIVENNGEQIFGVLHRPTQVENPPIVVLLHGFASSKHGSNRCYVKLAQALAQAGLAAFRFDFRGAGDSEGSLDTATFEDLISDAILISKYASSLEGIDGERLGIFGASLGGSVAVQACAKNQAAKALALWAPVASGELWFQDFLLQHPELADADPNQVLGSYRGIELNPLFKKQFAELFAYKTVAGLNDLPLLHMHGEGDKTISMMHQKAFKKYAGPKARFITYPEEQHSLGFAKAFPEVVRETVTFFKEHLQ